MVLFISDLCMVSFRAPKSYLVGKACLPEEASSVRILQIVSL